MRGKNIFQFLFILSVVLDRVGTMEREKRDKSATFDEALNIIKTSASIHS